MENKKDIVMSKHNCSECIYNKKCDFGSSILSKKCSHYIKNSIEEYKKTYSKVNKSRHKGIANGVKRGRSR